MSASACIEVSGLDKSYGNFRVLDQVSLSVATGSIHGLVGLNGSGKTTTLSCLLGLLPTDGGELKLLGLSPRQLHRAEGKVVAIFDSPSLHPQLTVRQALDHARLLCPRPVRSSAEVEAMLGLQRYSRFRIRNLSLGNRRRASIAHALLGNPELILLDEPFNGLDAGGVDDVLTLIGNLNRDLGCSFLLSSHQLPYLEQVCSHLAVLHQGRIVRSDTVDQMLAGVQPTVSVSAINSELLVTEVKRLQAQQDCRLIEESPRGCRVSLGNMQDWQLNEALVQAGVQVAEFSSQRASLDTVFRQLTAEATDHANPGRAS